LQAGVLHLTKHGDFFVSNFTKIENTILEAMVVSDLTGVEIRCLLFIIRKINGFHKESDYIAITQFTNAQIASRRGIIKALDRLQAKKIILKLKKGSNKGDMNLWATNKNIDEWELVNYSKLPLVNNNAPPSALPGKKLVNHSAPTKENNKRYIQKGFGKPFDNKLTHDQRMELIRNELNDKIRV